MYFDAVGINANYYLTLVPFTILVHEYCITFAAEVNWMWCSTFYSPGMSWNWSSFFFYLNRYLVLFGHGPVIMEFLWTTGNREKLKLIVPKITDVSPLPGPARPELLTDARPSCHALQSYHQYLAIVIQVVISCMLIMRVYALYERSRRALAPLVGLALAVVALGCWSVLGGKDQVPEFDQVLPVGCGAPLTHNQAIRIGTAWGGMLIFDTVVFGMTVLKSLSLRSQGQDLITVLLRDGAVYFSVIIIANLANILTFVLGGPFTRGLGTTSVNIISSVMISRLMLNLRDPNLVRSRRSGERGMASTAGVCPNISTFAQTYYPQNPEDGWAPTDLNATYGLDEEDNGHMGPGETPAGVQTTAIQLIPVDYRL